MESKPKEKTMIIKVLGPGCAKCEKAEKIVKEAVTEAGSDATVEKVTDMMEIAGFGVVATPSIVVDGEVKCTGKVPKKKEVLSWLGG
jgi:small redox-active disulfide protein 2